MLIAALSFAIMGVFVKQARRLPAWEIVFVRSLVNFVWLLPWALTQPVTTLFRKEPKALILRGTAGCFSMFLYYYAIEHLRLADAAMLNHTSPLIVLVISALFLGEKLSALAVLFIALAFTGVAFILKPDFVNSGFSEVEQLAGLAGFASAFVAAIAYISVKVATRSVSPRFIVFSFAAVASLVSLPLALADFVWPNTWEWLILFACGSTASIAQTAMTLGYARLPASVASPLLLVTVVFAALFGWMFWGEIPDHWSILGFVMVAVGLTGAYRYRWRSPI